MIDDDTSKQLLRINDELLQLCKWLNERCDMETSSRLIPIVDELTHRRAVFVQDPGDSSNRKFRHTLRTAGAESLLAIAKQHCPDEAYEIEKANCSRAPSVITETEIRTPPAMA